MNKFDLLNFSIKQTFNNYQNNFNEYCCSLPKWDSVSQQLTTKIIFSDRSQLKVYIKCI